MGGALAKRLGAATLALVLVGMIAISAWPARPRPVTPVPELSQTQDSGFQARLLPPQPGLVALPARVIGRSAAGPDGQGYRHEWPGFQAVARFQGRSVTLRFDDRMNRWRITLDGGAVEISRPGRRDLLIEGLPDGPHQIRAEKTSESNGTALFGGFFLNSAARPLTPPPARRLIEFIGDSDTVGLGDTAETRDCSAEEVYAATDTGRSFAPQVAAALDADYRMIARSGIGLLRNYGGAAPARTMDILYPLALPSDPLAPALPEGPADLVVIGLGSNVFGSTLAKDERWADTRQLRDDFGPALADFAGARARENPGAPVVLLAFGEYGPDLIQSHRIAADLLTARGIPNRMITLDKPRRNACLWHPSAKDHARIAEQTLDGLRNLQMRRDP